MTTINRQFAIGFFNDRDALHYAALVKEHHHFNHDELDAVDILLSYFKDVAEVNLSEHHHLISGILDTLEANLDGEVSEGQIKGIRRLIKKLSQVFNR